MSDRNRSLSRRKVLKSGSGSLAALTATGLVGATTSIDHVEIPVVKHEQGYVWKDVPEAWWEHEKKVERSKENIKDDVSKLPQVEGISIGTSDRTIS